MEIKKYRVDYLEVVVKKHIPALSVDIKIQIKRAIEERLILDPVSFGKPLQYSLRGHRRLRVGDYRIVFRIIEISKQVLVVAIMHRKDIYKK